MKELFNLKSYFTFLSRNKIYTAINVFGLSVALMFVMLIGLYVWQETNVDRQHSKAHRIYLVGTNFDAQGSDGTDGTHHAVARHLRKHYPEIERTCGFTLNRIDIAHDDEFVTAQVLMTDSTFFDFFDFPLLQGDRQTCLKDRQGTVITQRFARKLFGTDNALGRTIVWNDSIRFRVTGVVADFDNTIINQDVDMLVDFYYEKYFNRASIDETFPGMVNFTGSCVLVMAREGTDFMAREKGLTAFFTSFWPSFNNGAFKCRATLTPLDRLYLTKYNSDYDILRHGNSRLVTILLVVGLVILLFSVMNYINLTVAQSGYRARELATRRLFGAQKREVGLRLVLESVVLCLLSLVIAIVFAWALTPRFAELLNARIDFGTMLHPAVLAAMFGSAVLLGVVAGAFPAAVMSRVRPIEVVRGAFRQQTKMVFSRVFITLQNVITIVMLSCALIMSAQMQHLVKAPLGFHTDNLMFIYGGGAFDSKDFPTFINRLRQLPFVTGVAPSMGTPADGGNNNTVIDEKMSKSFQMFIATPEWMKLYGITLKDDHHVAARPVIYLNAQAVHDLEMKPTDTHMSEYYRKTGFYGFPKDAAFGGVVNDFHIRNILEDNSHPMLLLIQDKIEEPWNVTIGCSGGSPAENLREVQRVFKEVFHRDLYDRGRPYVNQQIEEAFEHELRTSHIVSMFALIAIIISLLGLVAMSTYFIQQRRKEIAVRKVFGSTSNQMRLRLVRTFLLYVLVAFVVAVPIVWYFMAGWISQYAYRIVWWPWLLAAGVIVLLISFAAVAVQSYVAGNENPVRHINENQ